MEGNRLSITSDYNNVDWSRVIPVLMAFAHKLLSQQKLRKKNIEEMSYDFAIDAIKAYLEDKEKFIASRNPDLIMYLKYSLLRRIISNYAKSADNRKISGVQIDDVAVMHQFIEEIPIDESIDIKNIVLNIQKDINHDDVMSIIFSARYEENMKRAEICHEFSIDTMIYDNAMKRLRRIVDKHVN